MDVRRTRSRRSQGRTSARPGCHASSQLLGRRLRHELSQHWKLRQIHPQARAVRVRTHTGHNEVSRPQTIKQRRHRLGLHCGDVPHLLALPDDRDRIRIMLIARLTPQHVHLTANISSQCRWDPRCGAFHSHAAGLEGSQINTIGISGLTGFTTLERPHGHTIAR